MSLLGLHFAQLSKIWDKSKNNQYSDKHRDDYHKKLQSLFQKLDRENIIAISEKDEIKEKKAILSFFAESITFLDNSTVNSLPFELVKCLEIALNDWVDQDEYVIVTSLTKNISEFSFEPGLALDNFVYEVIERSYDIKFHKRLIQVNTPEYLLGDYLANVVMYHELGHFIEMKYSLPDIIMQEFLDDFDKNQIGSDFHSYFPFVRKNFSGNIYSNECLDMLRLHIGEYFCDLFAGQYISECVNTYLQYISGEHPTSKTHPSTNNRVKLVKSFIEGKRSYTLNKIRSSVKLMTSRDLRVRYQKFTSNDFESFLPIDVATDKQLHFLFIYGWQLWQSDWGAFKRKNRMNYILHGNQVYDIINDLIEKSIGNHIVKTTWKDVSTQK